MTNDTRPVYVQAIDRRRRAAEAELAVLRAGINELRAYLNLPKFRARTELTGYVNVDDVLLRLNETEHAAVLAADVVDEIAQLA